MQNTNLAVIEQPATTINDLYKEIREHGQSMVEKAIQAGALLVEQKEKVGHGRWLEWVEANLIFGVKTAQNYIKCYQNRDQLKTKRVSHLRKAVSLLATPKKPVEQSTPQLAASVKSAKGEGSPPGGNQKTDTRRVQHPTANEACCTPKFVEWTPVKAEPWHSASASKKVGQRCDGVHEQCISLHLEMVKFFRNDASAKKEKLSRDVWGRLHEEVEHFAVWLLKVSGEMRKAAGIKLIEK